MPNIRFSHVSKSYGRFQAIAEFHAEIADREFLVLLGPSGCGKSTLLRMIAGLTEITTGTIELDGEVVNGRTPRERDVAFVFQSYALYPHMTVEGNIAFPLLMEHFRWYHHIPVVGSIYKRALLRRTGVRRRVQDIAEMMGIGDELKKRPKALSGGQRQRVAVARALVREPSLYLLDEPLSNLDAKLRTQTRSQITALHRRTGKSFIYVTHDQVEAMTMGTRIIVLDRGRIQQIGTPDEIYRSPANTFVAQFIGSPPMNLLPCRAGDGAVRVEGEDGSEHPLEAITAPASGSLLLGVRPEDVTLRSGPAGTGVPATVVDVERLGSEIVLAFSIGERPAAADPVDGVDRPSHYAKMTTDPGLSIGDRCQAELGLRRTCWFDPDTGLRPTDGTAAPVDGAGRGTTCASSQQS